MKLIKPSYKIIEQEPGIEGIYKQIELAGRTCYKSEDKITETSAKEFVDRMIRSGHGAMLEHGTVYLHMEFASKEAYFADELVLKYHNESHTKALRVRDIQTEPQGKQHAYIATNYRVLVENDWMEDLQYLCEPTIFHERRATVKFTCPISISREFNRHRVNSIAEQSTRYCNYSTDKFNKEITFIEPYWYESADSYTKNEFDRGLQYAEGYYMFMIDKGMKAQEAREILPLCTATELIHTAFVSDWRHFFRIRSRIAKTGKPHPQAQELADPLMDEFVKRGIMETLL